MIHIGYNGATHLILERDHYQFCQFILVMLQKQKLLSLSVSAKHGVIIFSCCQLSYLTLDDV